MVSLHQSRVVGVGADGVEVVETEAQPQVGEPSGAAMVAAGGVGGVGGAGHLVSLPTGSPLAA